MKNVSSNPLFFKGKFVVLNDRGLHTRPSTEVVKRASLYKSKIFLTHQKQKVNAKSLLGILMLGASKGSKITVEAEGIDSQEAVQALLELAQHKFYIHY